MTFMTQKHQRLVIRREIHLLAISNHCIPSMYNGKVTLERETHFLYLQIAFIFKPLKAFLVRLRPPCNIF